MFINEQEASQHKLNIPGTYNIRDLGGYATLDGHVTRWHMLLRGDKLDRISADGVQALIDYGVRTVLDLRYAPEVETEPDVIAKHPKIHYLHLPLYELNGDDTLPIVPDDLEHLYRLILDNRQAQIVKSLRVFLLPDALPALFHCTAGKDRTGLIAALVLGGLDVPQDTIVDDYMLSALYLEELFDELREQARLIGYDGDWYNRLLLCQPATMRHTLQYLDQRYGSVSQYLLQSGLSQLELDQLRRALVE